MPDLHDGVIHGVSAVAELKRDTGRKLRKLRATVIHGVSAVAELKRLLLVRAEGDRRVIHGVSAVAELKPGLIIPFVPENDRHPRRQCRGRIEAESYRLQV